MGPVCGPGMRVGAVEGGYGGGLSTALPHLAVGTVGGTDRDSNGLGQSADVELMSNRHSSVIDWRRHLARLEIRSPLPAIGGSRGLLGGGETSAAELIAALRRAARSRDVAGILLVIHPLGGRGLLDAVVQELRTAVIDTRRRNIAVVAYLPEGAGLQEYYLASAADRIVAPAMSSIRGLGSAMRIHRIPGLLRKLGIDLEQLTAGEYKATFQPTTEEPTAAQEALIRSLVAESYEMLTQALRDGRGLDDGQLARAASGALMASEEALAAGLIDRVGFEEEARRELRALTGKSTESTALNDVGLLTRRDHDYRWRRPRVAVLLAEGTIMSGRSKPASLLGGPIMGADTVCEQLDRLGRDPSVAAIVLRVESGGGSATASEQIRAAVDRVRKRGKPVVVSMGRVAASGGYLISCTADRILADPATLTGSIGVIGIRPVITRLLEKTGIRAENYQLGDHMDLFAPELPLDEEDRKMLQENIEVTYEAFLQRVAEGRNLPPSKVRELAEGKVYTGRQAHELGLVDQLGGLEDAVRVAASLAGLRVRPERIYLLPRYDILSTLFGDALQQAIGIDRLKQEAYGELRIW